MTYHVTDAMTRQSTQPGDLDLILEILASHWQHKERHLAKTTLLIPRQIQRVSQITEDRSAPSNRECIMLKGSLLRQDITVSVEHWWYVANIMRQRPGKMVNKLAPYGTDGRIFVTDVSAKFKVT